MSDIYDKNIKLLEARFPALAEMISTLPPDPNIEILPVRGKSNELFTLQVLSNDGKKLLLHSRYDPEAEAKRMVEQYEIGLLDLFVVFGFGMGYHIKELIDKTTIQSQIFVIETDLNVFKASLEKVDQSKILSCSRVTLLIGDSNVERFQKLSSATMSAFASKFHLVGHAPSMQLHKEEYDKIRASVSDFIKYAKLTVETALILPKTTLQNELLNLPLYVATPDMKIIENRFRGVPVVIVSAGPSLHRNIDLLKEIKGHAVIIAVSTTFKLLLRKGIIPDFTCVLDYHEVSRRYFEDVGPTSVHMIAGGNSTPMAPAVHQGPISFYHNDDIEMTLNEMKINKASIERGSTVAHLAFYISKFIGADPIIFIGQDLAHPDGVTHMPGTPIHEEWAPELNRFHTTEMKEWEQVVRMRDRLSKIKDIYGNDIYTDDQMLSYLQFFQRAFLKCEQTIVDATEGGARKEGALTMTLREAIDKYCTKKIPADLFKYKTETKWLDTSRFGEVLECLNSRIGEGNSLNSCLKSLTRNINKMQKAIDDPKRFDSLMQESLGLEVQTKQNTTIYNIITKLTQGDEYLRVTRDRELSVTTKTGKEKRELELTRDKDFTQSIINGQEHISKMLYDAKKALEDFTPSWSGVIENDDL